MIPSSLRIWKALVNAYSVEKVETLAPTEIDAVQNSGYDLVLYTCTIGRQNAGGGVLQPRTTGKVNPCGRWLPGTLFKNLFISAYKIKSGLHPRSGSEGAGVNRKHFQ